ncbi:MAG: hypothetical protein CMH62_00335 [Nanoarchaeota archaeon]|nr:hypothetical protein [Nanoarchaeota archaeon]
MAIRTNDGRFYRGLFGIITKQYQLAAYAWLQLYAIDQEFFSVFNREFINRQSIDENTIRDYDKLMNIVREIFVEKDIDIDEFIDRNHVLSKADRVEITPYSHGNNFIFFIIFKNSIGRERQPNQDDFSISMKVYDFNNNLVYESPLKKFLVAFGLEGQYQWIPPDFHSVNWERGRYRYDIIAEIEGIQYISSDWISPVTNGVGIDGIVIPYSSGKVKVRIIETGEEYDLVFSNGVFHTTSNGERELRQYRGLIEIEFQSPIGETMTRRTYKLTENMFVVLNFNPLIIHNTLRETIRDVPVVISAKAYDIDGLELHYKYEGRDEYNVLDMEVTDENTFSATIPNNEEDIQSILYFIKALGSNGLISSYPEDGVNSPFLISFLDSSLDSWSPDKLVSYSLADTDAYGDPGSFWGTDLGIFACNDEGLCTRESNFHGNPFPIGLEFSSDYRNAVITLKIPSQITIAENILEMVYEEDGEVKTIRIYLPSISTTNLSFTHELFVSADGSTYWKRNDDLGIDNGVFEDAENSLARASDEKLTFGESLNNLGEVL